MSYREEAMDIISIAQQASPNDIGQIELRRAQLTTLSSDASRIPSSFRKFASCPGASSVTPFASSTDIFRVSLCHHFASLPHPLQSARAYNVQRILQLPLLLTV